MSRHTDKTILFVSSCYVDWGGSEELWSKAALVLRSMGYNVIVYKSVINRHHTSFMHLHEHGIVLEDWSSVFPLAQRGLKKLERAANKITHRRILGEFWRSHTDEAFIEACKKYKPNLVVVAQGINFDGLHHAYQTLLLNIPYAVIAQKAVDFYWPQSQERPLMSKALLQAKKCFFVSQHNKRLTEEQFGIKLTNADIIFNPVKITQKISYPSDKNGYHLACVARLFILDKGQDMLLRVLSRSKWKNRQVTVSFVGEGEDMQGLKDMAALLGLTNICFSGQVNDIAAIWQKHHALILPSRSEGLPLSIVEAMAAGRSVITTNAGGNAELLAEGVTGFISHVTEDSLDEAMERAWEKRALWESMGNCAAETVVKKIPKKPEKDFAEYLNRIIHE